MVITAAKWSAILLLVLPFCDTIYLGELETVLQRYRHLMMNPEGLTYSVPTSQMKAEYDFIVIGAGPGGATVANRLTEVPGWNVLLLEAGGDELKITDIPVFAAHFQLTDFNWGYRAQRQAGACLGLKDQRCAWPRGKGMGGTSIINYMIYTRGHPSDYNSWVEMGNPGWGWDEVLRYFLKSERVQGQFADTPFHSTGGYLDVQDVPTRTPLSKCFLDSAEEVGYPLIDYTSGELIGFSYIKATIRNGSRCSASKAFLRPIRNRHNLHVAKYSYVTKILINPKNKRAYGVEFQRDGRRYSVLAKKEVILSGGAINTPQLLMLSGIGPREHLENVGVLVIQDLPGVGQNLQEHVAMCGLTFIVNDTVSIVEERLLNDVSHFSNYINHGTGQLTIAGGVEALGYVRTPVADTPNDYPDMELIFAAGTLSTDNGRVIRTGIGITDEIYNSVYKQTNGKDGWTIWPMILQPKSRGSVRLKTKNPLSWPLMYGNYFENEHDLDTLVEGIKFAVKLSKTQAFQRYNSTLLETPLPGCRQHEFGSDEYWRCSARMLTTTLHHQCGTAKMGPGNDPMAVVDHELRVYGLQGLRVADASIIPRIPAAHTNAPTYMIGEKAADMIKRTYGKA
jgi:choline dehydrogenase-like flavoprotein